MKKYIFAAAGVALIGLTVSFLWQKFSSKAILNPIRNVSVSPFPTVVSWVNYQREAETVFGGDKAIIAIIKETLGTNVFLRDVQPVPGAENIYLAIYIDNPVFDKDPDLKLAEEGMLYFSCPEMTIGQGIGGAYHLAAFQTGGQSIDLINEQTLDFISPFTDNPAPYQAKLSFKNTKFNVEPSSACKSGFEKCQEDQKTILVTKLLKFSEYTGDGKPNEFQIIGEQTPCGHIMTGVSGYNGKALQYPIYTASSTKTTMFDNFTPDDKGEVRWQFSCGDHGNQAEQNKLFRFNAVRQAYLLISASEKKCQ